MANRELVLELLKKRGITDEAQVAEFLSLKPTLTYDSTLLKDLEAGVDLILEEAKSGSKICIYGDYDADGVTATTLMLSVMRHLIPKEEIESRLGYYIPSRFDEGYGLNMEAIESLHREGYNLIITVDCGSVSYDEVEYAKSLGMKVIVTDHHTVVDKIADCILINPNQPLDNYPFKGLSGCGVAFKVAQRLQQKGGLPKVALTEVLDLVAIGTIGDIMPLVDENRTLVKFGLKVLNLKNRIGLKKLIDEADLRSPEISSENVAFVIVPHLNASGRIEDAALAVKLLDNRDGNRSDREVLPIVNELINKNRERKKLQKEAFEKCVELLRNEEELPKAILLNAGDSHEGITGIVAGKIKEQYYRPTILVTPTGENQLKGTGRSVDGVNLYELLKGSEELFDRFGGHKGACGFTMAEDNFFQLKKNLEKDMERLISIDDTILEPKYNIDLEIEPEDATADFANTLKALAPFGNGNPKPLFMIRDAAISQVRRMGEDGIHGRFFADTNGADRVLCVLFNQMEKYESILNSGEPVNLIGTLESQIWNGNKRVQFMVKDIQFDEY